LDKLSGWVHTEFSAIKNNGLPLADFSHCGNPFLPPTSNATTTAAAATPAPAAAAAKKKEDAKAKGKGGKAAASSSSVVAVDSAAAPAARSCLEQVYWIVPIKEVYKLHMSWVLCPSLQKFYAAKPIHYCEHLLGHEGRGSLFSLLRDRGWATSLVSNTSAHIATRSRKLNASERVLTCSLLLCCCVAVRGCERVRQQQEHFVGSDERERVDDQIGQCARV
jgi:secreted Zn-dependent insulinase-like peptidase